MISFELQKAHAGWKHSAIPDNLEITVRGDGGVHEMQAGLRELLILYDMVLKQSEVSIIVGTGKTIELTDDGNDVLFKKYPLSVQTTYGELQTALEQLLEEVFREQNVKSTEQERQKGLEDLEKILQSRESLFDVFELFERLSRTR